MAVLENAECLATSRPVSVALAMIRGEALIAMGQPNRAVEVFWAASRAIKAPKEQERMLTAFGNALVASGQVSAIAPKLRSVKASASVYVAVAAALVKGGNSPDALKILAAVQPAARAPGLIRFTTRGAT